MLKPQHTFSSEQQQPKKCSCKSCNCSFWWLNIIYFPKYIFLCCCIKHKSMDLAVYVTLVLSWLSCYFVGFRCQIFMADICVLYLAQQITQWINADTILKVNCGKFRVESLCLATFSCKLRTLKVTLAISKWYHKTFWRHCTRILGNA